MTRRAGYDGWWAVALCLALVALSPPAWAQGYTTTQGVSTIVPVPAQGYVGTTQLGPCCGGAPTHNATGYPDLDRAVAICDAHEAYSTTVSVPPAPPHYLPGYEACARVLAKRDATEQASREREARVREETDRKFLADFAGRLKP